MNINKNQLIAGGHVLYWVAFLYCVVLGQGVPQWVKTLAWVAAGFYVVRMVWRIYAAWKLKHSDDHRTSL